MNLKSWCPILLACSCCYSSYRWAMSCYWLWKYNLKKALMVEPVSPQNTLVWQARRDRDTALHESFIEVYTRILWHQRWASQRQSLIYIFLNNLNKVSWWKPQGVGVVVSKLLADGAPRKEFNWIHYSSKWIMHHWRVIISRRCLFQHQTS